jgi:hypothetical protein
MVKVDVQVKDDKYLGIFFKIVHHMFHIKLEKGLDNTH